MSFKVIKENILKANDDVAMQTRFILGKKKTLMVNIISSPGAGKTSLLEKVGPRLKEEGIPFIVITGDCFTTRDAERMDVLDIPAVQINTGNACHIDAALVGKALEGTDIEALDLIIVENVGNLVCPAEFDVGEDLKIGLFSTAEGADKPMKYPLLVKESELAIINKMDLIEYVDFDLEFCVKCINDVNPALNILKISCKTGEGIDGFIDWIKDKIKEKKEKQA